MGFDGAVFALTVVGPGDIEVAQRCCSQAEGVGVRRDHVIDSELRRTIRVRRPRGELFSNGNCLRLSICGRGGRENQVVYMRMAHRVKERQCGHNIVVPIVLRPLNRFADERAGSEMCNAVKLFVSEDICGDIADISTDKVCALGNKVGVSRREIVNNGDGMALFKQNFGDGAANVSCAACYENLHTVLHLSYVVVSLSLFICVYGAPRFARRATG